jgi:NAD(P)-dependent dehydrogenase (short-subunit alcohol dehydrogenase family)
VTRLLSDQDKTFDDIRNDSLLSGGVGEVDDISELVLFLSSQRAKNITGEHVVCDGGMMAAGSWLT